MDIIAVLCGAVILFLGRHVFWLLVGLLGFMAGFVIASNHLSNMSPPLIFLIAIAVGLIGSLVAIFLQRLAFALAGGFAGIAMATNLSTMTGTAPTPEIWVVFAGMVGLLMGAMLTDWAIIVLSSFAGASMIVSGVSLSSKAAPFVFLILAGFGIAVQARYYRQQQAQLQNPELSEP